MRETPSRTPQEIIEAAHLRAARLADEDAQAQFLKDTEGTFYGKAISLLVYAGYPREWACEEMGRYMVNESKWDDPLAFRRHLEVFVGEVLYARTETAGKNARNIGLIERHYDRLAREEREEAERRYR